MTSGYEIEESFVDGVIRDDGEKVDLWVLMSPSGPQAMFEVPHGEEPEVERFHQLLAQFAKWGADQMFLARVERRYVPMRELTFSPEPAAVQ